NCIGARLAKKTEPAVSKGAALQSRGGQAGNRKIITVRPGRTCVVRVLHEPIAVLSGFLHTAQRAAHTVDRAHTLIIPNTFRT
ncbi:MAG: hypothetical protein VX239_02835, partial [Candidatus Thermoplasmatota archaeon]|nr:hypothetical protein [Candidatus Thermoplasmatota archaeon]